MFPETLLTLKTQNRRESLSLLVFSYTKDFMNAANDSVLNYVDIAHR